MHILLIEGGWVFFNIFFQFLLSKILLYVVEQIEFMTRNHYSGNKNRMTLIFVRGLL